MAELTIVSASCLGTGTFNKIIAQAGETITAGMVVYKKASDSLYYKAQNDGTTEQSGSGVDMGISLTDSVLANQYFVILTSGTITIGATVVAGTSYYVGPTAGKIGDFTDVATGGTKYVTFVGYASSTTVLVVALEATGLFKA